MANIKWTHILGVAVTVFFTALLLANPSVALSSAYSALILCGTNVIPALFPFFVCANMFLSLHVTAYLGHLLRPVMQPLFRVRAEGALAFVMGIISGYPIGAKITADLVEQGTIPRNQGERMLAFCNNSGPLFLLGAVGSGMLGNAKFGMLLYLAHFLSSITVGLTLRCFGSKETYRCASNTEASVSKPFGTILGDAISNAANSIFMVCGFVIIFQIFLAMLDNLGIVILLEHFMLRLHLPARLARPILYSFFEPTGGCRACAQSLGGSPLLCLMMISAAVGWSGLSIHLQVAAMVRHAGLRLHYYWGGKALQAIVAPFYTFLLMIGMGDAVSVFAPKPISLPGPLPLSLPRFMTLSVVYFLLGAALLLLFIFCVRCIYRRHKRFDSLMPKHSHALR